MNVMVTGGAGFIGSHLIADLLRAGHRVVCVDDFSRGRRENLAEFMAHPHFGVEAADLRSPEAASAVIRRGRPECIFHLAANSDIASGAEDAGLDLGRTFLTTFSVLHAAREGGVAEFLFTSSSAVYGEHDATIGESTGPLRPISMYGAAKLCGEAYVSAFASNGGPRSWVFRLPNVVGERCTHGLVHDLLAGLDRDPGRLTVLGDGTQCKPYLYVKDLTRALLFTWGRARDRLNVFNVGVDSETTVRRVVEILLEEAGATGVVVRYTGGNRGWVGDVPRFQYNLARIHALGWRAERTSDEAVRWAVRAELRRRREGR